MIFLNAENFLSFKIKKMTIKSKRRISISGVWDRSSTGKMKTLPFEKVRYPQLDQLGIFSFYSIPFGGFIWIYESNY